MPSTTPCMRDGPRRDPPRQGVRRAAQALLRQVRNGQNGAGSKRGRPFCLPRPLARTPSCQNACGRFPFPNAPRTCTFSKGASDAILFQRPSPSRPPQAPDIAPVRVTSPGRTAPSDSHAAFSLLGNGIFRIDTKNLCQFFSFCKLQEKYILRLLTLWR